MAKDIKFIIHKSNASALVRTIFDCVEKGKDNQDKDIDGWVLTTTDKKEKVLMHASDQWKEKGNIHLDVIDDDKNDKIKVYFHYWSDYPEEKRAGNEDCYMLGRFTELLWAHFRGQYDSVEFD